MRLKCEGGKGGRKEGIEGERGGRRKEGIEGQREREREGGRKAGDLHVVRISMTHEILLCVYLVSYCGRELNGC